MSNSLQRDVKVPLSTNNIKKSPPIIKKPRGWKYSLNQLLIEHGESTANGKKKVSFATLAARRQNLFAVFREIRALGYKIQDVKNLKFKHTKELVDSYVDGFKNGKKSAATIRNRLSHLRVLARWIGKPGLVKPLEFYTDLPIKRKLTATKFEPWSNNGLEPLQIINAIRQDSSIDENIRRRIADGLLLQLLFGLRFKESVLLKPHIADKSLVLIVDLGSKGGRPRSLVIENQDQRELLNSIKSYIELNESMIPKDMKFNHYRMKVLYILRKYGATKTHRLRRDFLNREYEKVTGSKSPLCGGDLPKTNKELHEYGCAVASQSAGHHNPTTINHYIGGRSSIAKAS